MDPLIWDVPSGTGTTRSASSVLRGSFSMLVDSALRWMTCATLSMAFLASALAATKATC